ncbi:MAG: flagellar hook-associated protein FlgK [Gallionella sp.]
MAINLFTSGISGMNAAQMGMVTTEHNIANANTPGYTRQEVMLGSRIPEPMGSSFLGQGVDVVGVRRIYDQFLNTQVLQEQSQASYLSTYYTTLQQIDNMVADPVAGASPAIQEFFSALNGVANAPESIPARQTLLGSAQFVANRFQAIDQRLSDISDSLNGQISGSVNNINAYAQQIAALNATIKRATAATSQGQLPNDLIDQRDQLISQLNKEIKVSVQQESDGTQNVFIGNGQVLVLGEQAMSLRVIQSATDSSRVDIAYKNGNQLVPLQQSSLQGGSLGAYLAFRDQSLEPTRNALGRLALGIANSVNQQNQLGQDLNGVLGGNLFNEAAPVVSFGASNTGTANVTASITDVSALTTSNYRLRRDASGYSMVRLSDNSVTSLSGTFPQTVDGITVNLVSGSMLPGDSFVIRPFVNAASNFSVLTNDPAKIAAAAPIRAAAALTNLGTGKISSGSVDVPPPPNASLQNNVTVTFVDATHYTVVDNTAGATLVAPPGVLYDPAAGASLSFNGWTARISGNQVAGDAFAISANSNAAGDNRNALLMATLQTQNLLANGTTSLQAAYGQLIGEIGAKTHELAVTSQAQDSMVAQSVAAQQAISGVNLDEEAANLLRYQQAYQASARAMQIASTLFDTLLSLGK